MEDLDTEPVSATFRVRVDAGHSELTEGTIEPTRGPVTVMGQSGELGMQAFAVRRAMRSDDVWLEFFVENKAEQGLQDVRLSVRSVQGAERAMNVTGDPLASEAVEEPIRVGGVGPEGIGRAALAIPADGGEIELELQVTGNPTRFEATRSAPLALTPDGDELWAVFATADVVAVVDTASNERVAQVEIPGKPSSVAITGDGELALVAARKANTVTVIDRAERKVIQTFGEKDGIGRAPRHVVTSPNGGYAFVSSYVDDRLTRLVRRGGRYRLDGTVELGRRPLGMAVTPDSETVLIAHQLPRGPIEDNVGWVSVVRTEPLEHARDAVIQDPFNVDQVDCLAEVFQVSPERLTMEGVPTQLAGAFLQPGGARAWVPGMRLNGLPVIESGPDADPDVSFTDVGPGRFTPPFLFALDTRRPGQAKPMLNPKALDPRDASKGYLECANIPLEIENPSRQWVGEQEGVAQTNGGAAVPTASTGLTESGLYRFVAFSRGGRRMFALSHLADEILVIDPHTAHPVTQKHAQLSGSNPTGMAVHPNGEQAWVVYENSTFVSKLDISAYGPGSEGELPDPSFIPYEYRDTGDNPGGQSVLTQLDLVRQVSEVPETPSIEEVEQVALVDEDPMDPRLRRGKILFTSSNPDKYDHTVSRQGACESCHPDGGTDGSAWATVEGERRTTQLFGGVAGRGWLHASATHRNVEYFTGAVVRERLGGELSADDEKALARWVAEGIPKLQTPQVDEELAERGESLFQQNCTSCHRGEKRTSGSPDPDSRYGGGEESGPNLYDVGTQTDSAGVMLGSFFESILPRKDARLLSLLRGDRALGPEDPAVELLDFQPRPERPAGEFKAPALVNVWNQVHYFHDARFHRLQSVVSHFNEELDLGLSEDDRRALVEHLKTL